MIHPGRKHIRPAGLGERKKQDFDSGNQTLSSSLSPSAPNAEAEGERDRRRKEKRQREPIPDVETILIRSPEILEAPTRQGVSDCRRPGKACVRPKSRLVRDLSGFWEARVLYAFVRWEGTCHLS